MLISQWKACHIWQVFIIVKKTPSHFQLPLLSSPLSWWPIGINVFFCEEILQLGDKPKKKELCNSTQNSCVAGGKNPECLAKSQKPSTQGWLPGPEYLKGCTQSNFRLDLRIVLFGSLFNFRTYFAMYSSHHTNIMKKCLEDQVLCISKHNEVSLRLESFSNLT
jgi:hypothetical protein